MKKVLMFASAAIAALAMVSCNKEIETPESLAGEVCPDGYYIEELEATYPVDPATRTAFNETSGKFAWTEGDELAFHLSNGTYTSAPIDPATSKVKLYLPVGVTRDNYAVYPASAVVEEAATVGNMQVTLPSTYDISDNLTTEFVPMPLIATNGAENKNLKFEHVGALLQVNLNVPAGVKTAKLSMGKTITGTFDLAAGSGNGIIEAGETSDDALTFVLSEEGLADATTVKLLAPLPSGTYEKFEVAYDNGFAFTKDLSSSPWEFDRTQGKKVSISEENFEDLREFDCFWIEALQAGSTVSFTPTTKFDVKLYYSINDRHSVNFVEWDFSPITLENVGDRVYFYGDNTTSLSNLGSGVTYSSTFSGSGKQKVGGPLISLYTVNDPSGYLTKGYGNLFYKNTAIVDASELIIPTYTSSNYSYTPQLYGMFSGCTNLVNAPVLPAVTGVSSYQWTGMFGNCTSLTEAPDISSVISLGSSGMSSMFAGSSITITPKFNTALTRVNNSGCYYMFANCKNLSSIINLPFKDVRNRGCNEMFYNCTSLLSTPEIIVTRVEYECMRGMFSGCSNLQSTTSCLPATSLAERCYANMYQDCKKLMVAPELPATTLAPSCYSWMFLGCDIREVPALPATTVSRYSYEYMFGKNANLTSVPSDLLPAMTLGNSCYKWMFANCSKLENAPDLPATTLVTACYEGMFKNCTSLSSPITLPASDISPSAVYAYMFYNCPALTCITVGFSEWPSETDKYGNENYDEAGSTYNWVYSVTNIDSNSFYKPEALELKAGNSFIPSSWTVYNLEEVGAGM